MRVIRHARSLIRWTTCVENLKGYVSDNTPTIHQLVGGYLNEGINLDELLSFDPHMWLPSERALRTYLSIPVGLHIFCLKSKQLKEKNASDEKFAAETIFRYFYQFIILTASFSKKAVLNESDMRYFCTAIKMG